MPDLRIGERGEDVIDYMTDHFSGFFDAVKEVLNFCLQRVYDLLTVLFALVLFLTALSQRDSARRASHALLGVAAVMAIAGVIVMATYPIRLS